MSNKAVRKQTYTTGQLATFVPVKGDTVVDLSKPTVVVGDGTTTGGVPLAKEVHTHANVTSGTPGFMSGADKAKLDDLSSAGGIQNILADTVPLTPRTTANFSTDFSISDNSGASRTEFAISQGLRDSISSDAIALIIALS